MKLHPLVSEPKKKYDLFITSQDRNALKACIRSWKRRAAGHIFPTGVDSCALCAMYHNIEPNSCKGCPIAEWTHYPFCSRTPYMHYCLYPGSAVQKAKLAQQEVHFLESLLEISQPMEDPDAQTKATTA